MVFNIIRWQVKIFKTKSLFQSSSSMGLLLLGGPSGCTGLSLWGIRGSTSSLSPGSSSSVQLPAEGDKKHFRGKADQPTNHPQYSQQTNLPTNILRTKKTTTLIYTSFETLIFTFHFLDFVIFVHAWTLIISQNGFYWPTTQPLRVLPLIYYLNWIWVNRLL